MKLSTVLLVFALVALPLCMTSSLKEGLTKNALPFTDENVLSLAREFIADLKMEDERFKHFKESVRIVREHNSKSGNTYTLDVDGPFAFMSNEEFFANNLGGSSKSCETQESTDNDFVVDMLTKVPKSIDWNEKEKVSPVKDQQSCSSSWAFATTAAIESHYAILEDVEAPSLSEQQLVDCSTDNNGCSSGLPSSAFEYVQQAGGIAYENSYFYESLQQECAFSKETVGARVSGFENVASGNEKKMKQTVAKKGPVTAVFSVLEDFKLYKSGIYSSLKCSSSKTAVNHAVLIVGYGTKLTTKYWIGKNSWSEFWGEDGFFKIKRGNNMCGIANCVSYPKMSGAELVDANNSTAAEY